MQINNLLNYQNIQLKQDFKNNSAGNFMMPNFPAYQPMPLTVSKSYISPQITKPYKEIKTFNLPYLGEGKLYELTNGHKVILVPKAGQTIIHTSIGVGKNNEPAHLKEMSHVLEHLVSGYDDKIKNNKIKKSIDKISANFNANTAELYTGYHINASVKNSQDFEELVNLQAQTLQNKDFTDKEVESCKKIVIQELDSKRRFTDNEQLADRLTKQNLFNLKDSNDAITPESISTISNIKREDLLNYYNTFYRPDNMVTTVIGNVDNDSIKTVAKYFNNFKQPQLSATNIKYPNLSVITPIQKTIRKDVQSLDKNNRLAHIDLAFLVPKINDDKESASLEILDWVIDKKIKAFSRKNKRMLYMSSRSYNVSSDKEFPSIFRLNGRTNKNKIEENLKSVYSILYGLTQKPISQEELTITKDNIKSDWTKYVEDSLILSIGLSRKGLLSQNLDRAKVINKIDSLTAQDVQNTAKKYLDLNKASLVVIHPQEKAEKNSKVSFKGNLGPIDAKGIQEYVLPNNLRVIVDPRPGIARTTIKFDLNSKKILYANPAATWHLAVNLASEQTRQNLKERDILLRLDGNSQHIYETLNGSADKTLEMLEYAKNILLYPNLNAEDLNKEKKIFGDNNDRLSEKLMQIRVKKEILKENPSLLTPKGDLKGLELEDVKNLHQQIFKKAQGAVFITIPSEDFQKNQSQIFKKLMSFPQVQPYDYKVMFNKYKLLPLKKSKVLIEENKRNQIRIKKIFKIIESGNIKDRAGLMLLNHILGGDNKSKLFNKLRNKDNIAYFAASSLDTNPYMYTDGLSLITLSTEVSDKNKNNLHTVVSEFDNSINELINNPVGQEELNRAKNKTKSFFSEQLEESENRNDVVSKGYNSFYGTNYQQALFNAIDNTTPEYLQQLAKYYLTQPYLMTVSGNKETINANKEYLSSLGEVVY